LHVEKNNNQNLKFTVYLFRGVTKHGKVTEEGIQPTTVARIIYKRATLAGLDPRLFGGQTGSRLKVFNIPDR
jgi:hypothetical protein